MILIFLLVSGCEPEKNTSAKMEALQQAARDTKYDQAMLCMEYIFHHGNDPRYSKELVQWLLDLGFHSEVVFAVESLLERYPGDTELYQLRATAYELQHQYDLALADAAMAANSPFTAGLQRQYALWREIQLLNKGLTVSSDSFDIMLQRAGKLFEMQKYDAALYDLGAISKMRSPADSVYFTQQVKSIYKKSRPVEALRQMLEYFRREE